MDQARFNTCYLSDRYQYTVVDGSSSDMKQVSTGVPQGSILGPLLFTCYINDLPKYSGELQSYLYAEDTALLSKGKNIIDIQDRLQRNYDIVLQWLAVNKLSLNVDKTKVVLFSGQRSKFADEKLCIKSGGTNVEQVDIMKYLGIYLDKFLTFDTHIDKICKKVDQRTRLLWKMRNFITQDLAKYLYQTLINPIFTYCDFIYDGTTQKNKNKLQIKQNAALRAVTHSKIDTAMYRIHDELLLDDLTVSRRKSTLKMVYRGYSNQGPPHLNKMFENYIPSRNLRSENQLLILPPPRKHKFSERDIAVRGCNYWNPLPSTTKINKNLMDLKNKLKVYGVSALSGNI